MSWVNKYIGIPFKEKGRSFSGVDCWGLVYLVYKNELQIELPTYIEFYESPDDRELLSELIAREQVNKWNKINDLDKKPFDGLLLTVSNTPYHVGIYIGEGQFIHCEKGVNTAIARLNSIRWRNNLAGVFRWVS